MAELKDTKMDFKAGNVSASLEALVLYNVVTTEAIFELLVEKGILTKEEVKDRIAKLRKMTKISIQRIQ